MTALLFFALLQPLVCQPLQSDSIYGRNLASAVPELAKLPPDLFISFSPVPGQSRVFHSAELRRIALSHQLPVGAFSDVCFAWTVSVPSRDNVLAGIKKTLANRTSHVELVDQSLIPAPSGTIVFPLSGLSGTSEGPQIWRGYVQYAEKRRFPIWVRVRITIEEKQLVTTANLGPDQPIQPYQLRLESYSGPIRLRQIVSDSSKAIGFIPKHFIPAGTALTEDMIQPPFEVERGDFVEVIVEKGAARVEAQGIAQQSGRSGQIICVQNAKTRRPFEARIEQKDLVVLVPGGPIGLAREEDLR